MSKQLGLRIIGLLFFVLGSQVAADAQYCGGTLEYVVRDKNDRVMEASALEILENKPSAALAYVRKPSRANVEAYENRKLKKRNAAAEDHANRKPSNIEGMHVSTFAIRMGCGLPLLELTLKHEGEVMKLRFLNISEMDSALDSLPFQSGTFEIDFAKVYAGYPTDKSNFNMKGLESGGEIFLPWHAKGSALIDSKNWRKTSKK